jgi:hypothetical protein
MLFPCDSFLNLSRPRRTSMTFFGLLSGLKLSLMTGEESFVGSVLTDICRIDMSSFSNFTRSSSRISAMEIGMFGFGSLPLEYPLELLGFLSFLECFIVEMQLFVGFTVFVTGSFRNWLSAAFRAGFSARLLYTTLALAITRWGKFTVHYAVLG